MNNKSILVIIPARGGSKGIPRKNLRSLNGKPLIFYAISTALNSNFNPDVYVSSEDEEILSIASKIGAKTIKRNLEHANDETTLDPVIYNAFIEISKLENKKYDLIVTLQPTSPLLKSHSLDNAILHMIQQPITDTVISAVNDTHLTWKISENRFTPNYIKRVNRQYLPPIFKETGGFLITRSNIIEPTNRIGSNVHLHILNPKEAIDIDSFADWGLCEFYLKRKKILFVVSGNTDIGLGHVYNTLSLANDMVEHDLQFLVDTNSQLAYEKIASKNYQVIMQTAPDIKDDIQKLNPDIIINDKLDTSDDYVKFLKHAGYKVINFEDLGSGARYADLTINAIYPEKEIIPNHYFGHKYFILRDEFLLGSNQYKIKQKVTNILLTFGGVDPSDLTQLVLSSIIEEAQKNKISVNVVTGLGYKKHEILKSYKGVHIHHNVSNISEYMAQADIIFTSAGRTIYEVAALRKPTIVLAQNSRELTHFFANAENGFINLGLGELVNQETIKTTFMDLLNNHEQRLFMANLMGHCDLSNSKQRVLHLINQVINA